tara:strand:+ start:158 stop:511 length:354 start_codon:yes stop_codon:yes gene_type:complete
MEDIGEKNPQLEKEVEKDTPMKEWLVDYVGEKFQLGHEEHRQEMKEAGEEPEEWDGSVSVEMILEQLSVEFPEFVMALAEENWIRGYHQALSDVEEGEKLYKKELGAAEGNEDVDEE